MSLLAPADWEFDHEVQHVPPTVEQNGIGVTDTASKIPRDIVSGTNKDTSSPQTSRNIGYHQN